MLTQDDFLILAKQNSMMGLDRLRAIWSCLEEIRSNDIHGDIVQCGVWRGGVTLAILEYLRLANMVNKKVWVYDTFGGMCGASDIDVTIHGDRGDEIVPGSTLDCEASIEQFTSVVSASPLVDQNLVIVKGDVSKTLLSNLPDHISFLHLDTDFYQSTLDELKYLAPLVDNCGVIMIDDYGHWAGCRVAVDEYFADKTISLEYVDYTAIIIHF